MSIELTDKMSGIDFKNQVEKSLDKTGDTMTGALIPRTVTQSSDYTEDEVVPYSVVKSTTPYKIGDIFMTVRNDLGDKWLHCDGALVDYRDYPELDSILRSTRSYSNILSDNYMYRLDLANNYLIACGHSSDREGEIYYVPTNVIEDAVGSVIESSCKILQVIYGDGYWLALSHRNTSEHKYRLYYSTSLDGEWKELDLDASVSYLYINKILYHDGYWVVVGETKETSSSDYYRASLYYTRDLLGEWVSKDITIRSSTSNEYLPDITYAEGNWVILASCGSTYQYYAYTDNITKNFSDWTMKQIDISDIEGYKFYNIVERIEYINGMWIITTPVDTGSSARPCINYMYSSDLHSNNWTKAVLPITTRDTHPALLRILYDSQEGYWTYCTKYHIYRSTGLNDGNLIKVYTPDTNYYLCDIALAGGKFYRLTQFDNSYDASYLECAINYMEDGDKKLPSNPLNGVFTYIKAKE